MIDFSKYLFFDGAMGTMLQKSGLKIGELPELLNLTKPDTILKIHKEYVKAGANVIMPNLSPTDVRKDYLLYDGKICTGDEAAECKICLEKRVENAGYKIVTDRGDVKKEYK